MMDYLNDEQANFFKWCDEIVRIHISREGTTLSQWHPRKNHEGGYELVFELTHPDNAPLKRTVSVPKQFHELLEKEYFIHHPDSVDKSLV